jgi:uracil-DNA glycosylase
LKELARQAQNCRNFDLWRNATQTVFGEGSRHALIMMVGEQPGDQEDLQGKPFVGPAGKLLQATLKEAGVDPKQVYLTNAVKHFKWEPRGEASNSQKAQRQRNRCLQALAGCRNRRIETQGDCVPGRNGRSDPSRPSFRVTEHRGELLESSLAPYVMAMVHPSSILRAPDEKNAVRTRTPIFERPEKAGRNQIVKKVSEGEGCDS